MKTTVSEWKKIRPNLNLSTLFLTIRILRLGKVMEDEYDRSCRQRFDLKGSDMRVLFALLRGGIPYSKRPTDLFKSLLVTSGAISKQIDRLARVNLVERLPDARHRGGYLIHLTRQGKRVADAALEMFSSDWIIHSAFSGLDPKELKAAIRIVDRLLDEVETTIDSAKRNPQ